MITLSLFATLLKCMRCIKKENENNVKCKKAANVYACIFVLESHGKNITIVIR